MIAEFIFYKGETIALCLAQPERQTKPELRLQLPTDIAWHPISHDESRRSHAASVRYAQSYHSRLGNAADATEFRMWLNKLHAETVAVPIWTDRCLLASPVAAGARTINVQDIPVRSGAEYILTDFDTYEIVTASLAANNSITIAAPGTAQAWPAGTAIYPLLFGRLTERPELTSVTPERAVCDLKFQEDSPFARRLNPSGTALATVGPGIPALAALPLWDIEPNHVRMLDRTEVEIIYELIGFGRVDYKRVYDLPIKRGLEMEFLARSRAEIAKIEQFFFDRRGTTRSFMIPTFRGDMRLTQDLPVAGNPKLIPLEPSEFTNPGRAPHPGDPYIALVERSGGVTTVDARRISSTGGGNLTADIALTQAHEMEQTRVSHLLMVRFAESKLTWSYQTDGRASAKIKFVELPNDYADGGAALKEPVYLYRLTHKLPVPQVFRYTSYENQFVVPSGPFAGTYTPADFSWEGLDAGIDLEDKVEVSSSPFAGNPLNDFFPFVLEGLLGLEIMEANAAAPAALPKSLFAGEVAEFDPKAWKATCDLGGVMHGKFPQFLLQTIDNYSALDANTKLNPAAFKISGTIASLNGQTINLTSAAANGKPADWFAWGWLETGVGSAYESRSILKSTAITGGVQLVLDRLLLKAVVGQAFDAYPGYDGTIEQCETKFVNRLNHGGHPYAPDTPPNIKVLKATQPTGGKKG